MEKNKRIIGGAVIWARKATQSEIFYLKPDKWFKIWFYLVSSVNHKATQGFERGECFMTYKEITLKTGATKPQIDHCIRWLKKATMLATRKTTRGMFVKVLNYAYYQNLDNYSYLPKATPKATQSAIQKRHRSDTINNNDKNDKNAQHADSFNGLSVGELISKYGFKQVEEAFKIYQARKNTQNIKSPIAYLTSLCQQKVNWKDSPESEGEKYMANLGERSKRIEEEVEKYDK